MLKNNSRSMTIKNYCTDSNGLVISIWEIKSNDDIERALTNTKVFKETDLVNNSIISKN